MKFICFALPLASSSPLSQRHSGSHFCARRNSIQSIGDSLEKKKHRFAVCMTSSKPTEVSQLLKSEDFLERIRGINRIDELPSISEKLSSLIPIATGDSNQQVRYAAVSRISNLDASELSKEDAATVLDAARYVLLNDKEPSCQSGAADLIAGLKLSDGFDDLVEAFNRTSDWMLKFSIAAGLGEMGDPKAFDFLTSILSDNDEGDDLLLVTAAIGALGELGDQRGVPVIEKFLDSNDDSIRERAAIAHGMLVGGEGKA